jgi:hypothetical protein
MLLTRPWFSLKSQREVAFTIRPDGRMSPIEVWSVPVWVAVHRMLRMARVPLRGRLEDLAAKVRQRSPDALQMRDERVGVVKLGRRPRGRELEVIGDLRPNPVPVARAEGVDHRCRESNES